MAKKSIPLKFQELLDIMKTLRSPKGCPWDREQNRHSLKPYLLEEAHEVLEALDKNDTTMICEELGDLLLQIVFHSQIAEENNEFSIENVLDMIINKLIRRHPHVYGEQKVNTSKEVLSNWNSLKLKEKEANSGKKLSVLGQYPPTLPLLHKCLRITDKASKVGFDWPNITEVLNKIDEENLELKQAIKNKQASSIENEIGDLIFSIINLARFVNVNPEIALKRTLDKFIRRFTYIEDILDKKKISFYDCDINTLETYWKEAKEHE